MKPVFIFIIIIAIAAAVYFIFFNKDKKTQTYVKCVNDTKTKNKFGLLKIPCLVTGLSLEETTAYINNLNDFMKDKVAKVSEQDQENIKKMLGTNGLVSLTTDEQSAVIIDKLSFVLKSMPFSNSYNGISNTYTILTNESPSKYIALDNIKVIISGLQKQIYNTNIYLKNLYEYMDKQDKISDALASTAATFISLYIYLNNILNFIQTH